MKERPDGLICTFPKCGRAFLAHGLCSGHYKQYKLGKKLKPLRRKLANNTQTDQCTVFECLSESYAKGMCKAHYERARKAVKERMESLSESKDKVSTDPIKEPDSNG